MAKYKYKYDKFQVVKLQIQFDKYKYDKFQIVKYKYKYSLTNTNFKTLIYFAIFIPWLCC